MGTKRACSLALPAGDSFHCANEATLLPGHPPSSSASSSRHSYAARLSAKVTTRPSTSRLKGSVLTSACRTIRLRLAAAAELPELKFEFKLPASFAEAAALVEEVWAALIEPPLDLPKQHKGFPVRSTTLSVFGIHKARVAAAFSTAPSSLPSASVASSVPSTSAAALSSCLGLLPLLPLSPATVAAAAFEGSCSAIRLSARSSISSTDNVARPRRPS
mmetsp:Transcript_71367/g.143688  ORF Transcript_71367/g.143688 Transcript_71367/m.143688 type:complete len:218 (-) Transcript_71367:283-936(-)